MFKKSFLFVICLVLFLNNYADSTLILSKPKASLHLFTAKKSTKITHLTSYQIQRTKPVKFILHGYKGSSLTKDYIQIVNKYISLDYNVIAVDYPSTGTFVETYRILTELAEYLAAFIRWLNFVNFIPLENIHMIGFSVGAQIAGMTGGRVDKSLKRKLGRITALSPTRIGFESVLVDDINKLDPSDARFVDVLHTDVSVSLVADAGHVDYYPNAGDVLQPGCECTDATHVLPEIPVLDGWDNPISADKLCSHALARSFFTEAILSDKFIATKCDSWRDFQDNLCDANQKIVFGENTDKTARGKFFFATRPEWPYYITS